MSPPPALLEALRGLQDALSREDLRWYVFGAQAVVLYGQPRLTFDLDVTVEATLERAVPLLASLRDHGFESRAPDPEALGTASISSAPAASSGLSRRRWAAAIW